MLHRLPSLIIAIITSVAVLAWPKQAAQWRAPRVPALGRARAAPTLVGQLRPAWVQMRAAPTLVHRRLQE